MIKAQEAGFKWFRNLKKYTVAGMIVRERINIGGCKKVEEGLRSMRGS